MYSTLHCIEEKVSFVSISNLYPISISIPLQKYRAQKKPLKKGRFKAI
jgi:hypothetical protein